MKSFSERGIDGIVYSLPDAKDGAEELATPSGRLVQRALAFIRAHYAEPIRPQDVVKELKVSRRFADLRFSAIQGESMGKAILRMRLEAVCRRLVTTNDTFANIAALCGFGKLDRLNAALKNVYRRIDESAASAAW